MRGLMLNNLTGTERTEMEMLLQNAQKVIKLITEKATADYDRAFKSATSDLNNPNWALKQAFYQGVKKGLTILEDYAIIKE